MSTGKPTLLPMDANAETGAAAMVLSETEPDPPKPVTERQAPHPPEQLLGKRIGPYILRRKLGQGGFGSVFEAEHESIGQRVAIKLLDPRWSHERKISERFLNEARATSIVRHPGLVKVYDYTKTAEGSVCLIMEYLEGESVEACLEKLRPTKERLPIPRAVELVRQAASALQAVHAAEIVHCDLKPDNIFLVPDSAVPGGERVKLLDFGIAKFLTQSLGQTTTTDLIMGSPRYMAPEQCEGREQVSSKADVYALGVIFYELLAGERPFQAQSPTALLRQHINMKPPPLRARTPEVSEDLAVLVHDMLAKNGADRPSMVQILSRLETGASRSRTRRRRALILLFALLPTLLAVAGWRLWRRLTPSPAPTAPAIVAQPVPSSHSVPTLTQPPPVPPSEVAANPDPSPAPPPLQPPLKRRTHRAAVKRNETAPKDSPDNGGEAQKGVLKPVNFGKD